MIKDGMKSLVSKRKRTTDREGYRHWICDGMVPGGLDNRKPEVRSQKNRDKIIP